MARVRVTGARGALRPEDDELGKLANGGRVEKSCRNDDESPGLIPGMMGARGRFFSKGLIGEFYCVCPGLGVGLGVAGGFHREGFLGMEEAEFPLEMAALAR